MSRRLFQVEGQLYPAEIVEFGYPPMREPRRDSQDDGWQEQAGLFGRRAWIIFRSVGGPADGLTFSVHKTEKIELVQEGRG